MAHPLTLDEVLDAGLPASSEGELYRFVPSKGFYRSGMTRFAPSLLPIRFPAHGHEMLWYHDEGCDCRFCQPVPESRTSLAKELAEVAQVG